MADMAKFYQACTRKTWVTRGADPTEVVEWTVPATDSYGNVLETPGNRDRLIVREFQGIYNGWIERDRLGEHPVPTIQVPTAVAELTHKRLEELYDEEQHRMVTSEDAQFARYLLASEANLEPGYYDEECEHGYPPHLKCRGCDPDGI